MSLSCEFRFRVAPATVYRRWQGVAALLLVASTLLIALQPRSAFSQVETQAPKSPTTSQLRTQHFVCNLGYSRDLCHQQSVKLAAVLVRYQYQLPDNWTWVLVRSDDWSTILRALSLDVRSPAFSVLAKRQTFLNEALFAVDAKDSAELLREFKVPLDEILDVAVSHELGHSFCMEVREREAGQSAEQLRKTGSAQCHGSPNPATRDTLRTFGPPW